MKKILASLFGWALLLPGCTQSPTTDSGGDAGRDDGKAKVDSSEVAKRLVGRWKHSEGESWQFLEIREDGTYRRSQHHDGAGGREGTHTDGKYRVLAGGVIEFAPDKGEVHSLTVAFDDTEMLLKPHNGRWRRQ